MYYAYIYYEDKIPFYVGKGSLNRYIEHWNNVISGNILDNKQFNDKLNKLFKEGKVPEIKRIYCDNSDMAFELEEFLITEIGRLDLGTGPLCNLTDGGKGLKKYILSDEHKDKIRKSNSERELSENVINNFCKWNIGISPSEEVRKKISNSNKGKKRTPEQKERYRQAALNRTDEHKRKILESKSKNKNP